MEETLTKANQLQKCNNEKEYSAEYDKCWSWFVLFGAFVILSTFGLFMYFWDLYNFGLFEMTAEFNIYIHVIICMNTIICYILAPLSSLLIKLFGFTLVTVVGSHLAGISMMFFFYMNINEIYTMIFFRDLLLHLGIAIGLGLMYFSAITIVITYFKKFRPLAIGIAVSAVSEISIFFNINEKVISFFRTEGGNIGTIFLLFLCFLCGIIFRPLKVTPTRKTQNDTENPQVINSENTTLETNNISQRFKEWISDMISLFKNPVFIFFVVIWTCFSIAQHMAFNYILANKISLMEESTRQNNLMEEFNVNVNLIQELRIPKIDYYLYTIALSGFFGRILFGLIFSIPQLTQHRNKIFSLSILVSGIASAIIIPCNNITLYTICLIVIFVLTSGSIGMLPVIVADLMTPKLFSNAFSLLLFFSGITMLFEYNIIYLVDKDDIEISLIIFGSIISLCGLLLFFIPTLQTKLEKRHVNSIYLQTL